jgi:murein DD-endopeptidase MepM/ murein hydrolase activator NlpD
MVGIIMINKGWPWLFLLFPILGWANGLLEMKGAWIQGGVIIGRTVPSAQLKLNGESVRVSPEGRFVFGFGRDAVLDNQLEIRWPDGIKELRRLTVKPRHYKIQRIDGLPPTKVNPPAEIMERIQQESAQVAQARDQNTDIAYFSSGFVWPLQGRISGVYGSQRVLNGQPRQPHYGIDIAASIGTPVQAPADGVVTLAHPDMYFSGKTLVIDHGYGLSSSFLHLNDIYVVQSQKVKQGDIIATVGATGRVTGPHLDWRMNWFSHRVDPSTVVAPMKVQGLSAQLISDEDEKEAIQPEITVQSQPKD